jgi:hypothetical protein
MISTMKYAMRPVLSICISAIFALALAAGTTSASTLRVIHSFNYAPGDAFPSPHDFRADISALVQPHPPQPLPANQL